MKIKFYWYLNDGEKRDLLPAVDILDEDEKMTNCLQGLLTDDTGMVENSIDWLEKGVEIFNNIEKKHSTTIWDRDSWGCEYINGRVKLYSLYDDEYYAYLTLNCFKKILNTWLSFNKSLPDIDSYILLEIKSGTEITVSSNQ